MTDTPSIRIHEVSGFLLFLLISDTWADTYLPSGYVPVALASRTPPPDPVRGGGGAPDLREKGALPPDLAQGRGGAATGVV